MMVYIYVYVPVANKLFQMDSNWQVCSLVNGLMCAIKVFNIKEEQQESKIY